jgi:WASH complex subunit strumpellin
MRHMTRIVQFKPILLTHISYIADISYSWQCLKGFQAMMQEKVKQSPHAALLLKTTFQKLSSILNTPMIRIIQANSPDMSSVSKYYSGELIKFVREVLQIIPIQIFEILQDIIVLITSKLRPLPPKINKNDLKDYA